jgi:hypothetical protein
MPVVICIGLGSNDSGHDGNNYLEDYISRTSDRYGSIICVSAGNEALAGHHTDGSLAKTGDTYEIGINSGDDAFNETGFLIHIWNNRADLLSVSVRSPLGEEVQRVAPVAGTNYTQQLVLSPSSVNVQYFYPNPRSGAQISLVTVTFPTPGIWTITIHGERIAEGSFNAWFAGVTGQIAPSLRFVRPSSYCTITPPGTALSTIVVGAYSASGGNIYPPSSWGPTRLPSSAPTLAAPGEDVGGIFPDGPGAMSGTSVSAAITAGACALLMEWAVLRGHDPYMNSTLARAYLIRGCERDAGINYPNEQWGYGRLSLWDTFVNLQ